MTDARVEAGPSTAAAPVAPDDAAALAWLDRLLDAGAPERDAALDTLGRADPALRARLQRLLAACGDATAAPLLAPAALAAALAAPAPHPGATLAGYLLLRELGRGGSAVVWLARRVDGLPAREVALKLPLFALATPAGRARVERERELLAALEHPGIARLYDAGVDEAGRPFLALERVDGEPLTQHADRRGLGVRARVALFLQVLEAVGHAHAHMVVHRDLKPSNVLVDAGGRVRLLDFGIAKLLDAPEADAALTREAGCALTPRYAAPEQLEGGAITAATDVHALGVLLHELLGGGGPHGDEAGTVAGALHALLHGTPRPPSRGALAAATASACGFPDGASHARALAGDLDTVVMKAIRRVPAERYPSVERLADDLRAWLAHRPIAARPPSPMHRARLFLRRHRAASHVAAVAVAGLLALAALLAQQQRAAADQRLRAEAARDFLLDLVEDVEPDEGGPPAGRQSAAEVTGRTMLDKGLARAHERFAGQPQLLGEVLGELARMLDRLGEDDRAEATLREADALLQAHAPAGDPARHKVRVQLAEAALADGRLDEAATLAAAAIAGCTADARECAKARASARTLLAGVAGLQGRDADGLAQLRQAVDDAVAGFGPRHAETALLWDRLAVAARNADDLALADEASARALALAEEATLAARDRRELRRTRALVDLDLGRVAAARPVLHALAATAPDGVEGARLQRLASAADRAAGDLPAARAAADRAVALAVAFPGEPERWYALQAQALAASLAGEHAAARAAIARVRAGLAAAGHAPTAFGPLAAQRVEAEILARAGEVVAASRALDAHARAAAAAPLEAAQGDDLRGTLAAAAGRPADAAAWHARAQALYTAARLPASHPWVARHTLYRLRADWLAHPSPATRAALGRAVADWSSTFDAASCWPRLAAALLSPPAADGRPALL